MASKRGIRRREANQRKRACDGKKAFPNPEGARVLRGQLAGKDRRLKRTSFISRLGVYLCPHCKLWHVGNRRRAVWR